MGVGRTRGQAPLLSLHPIGHIQWLKSRLSENSLELAQRMSSVSDLSNGQWSMVNCKLLNVKVAIAIIAASVVITTGIATCAATCVATVTSVGS